LTRLRIGAPYAPTGIDPHVNSSELAYKFFCNAFDPLVRRTPDGQYQPGLATRWELSADRLTYTFTLRTGVRFHDDTPLDPTAVKASFDRIVAPETASQAARDMLGPFDGCAIVDDCTVQLQLSEPYAPLLDALSQAWLAPASPAAVRERGVEHLRRPVGTGPYKVEGWPVGGDLTLVANAVYQWGPPRTPRVEFTFLPDPDTRLPALERGDIHAFYELAPDQIRAAQSLPDHVVELVPVPGAPVSLMLNTRREPSADPLVRKALAHALNVPELVRRVFDDVFPVATAPLSATTWAHDPDLAAKYPHDLASAATLLDHAGWRVADGEWRQKASQRLVLPFFAIPHARYPEIGHEVARQLRPLGIHVDVNVVSITEWLAAGNSGRHCLIPVGKFTSEPDVLEVLFHSRHNGHGYAWSWSQDATLDDWLTTAVRSGDAQQRMDLFTRIQQRIITNVHSIPLHENLNASIRHKDLRGLTYDLRGYPVLYSACLDEDGV
jgi:peptide/nickel transport system substrate-binding protein